MQDIGFSAFPEAIKGKPVRRNSLKQGMACDITYTGDGSEAKIVACK